MKKVLFSLIMALFAVPVFAVEFESGEFKANIYGEIYGLMVKVMDKVQILLALKHL